MRVDSLVVINLSDNFGGTVPTEDREAAHGLYTKHTTRTDGGNPKAAWWIEINNTKETGDKTEFTLDIDYKIMEGGPLPSKIDAGNTGIYLIFHAKESSDPNIFGVVSLGKAEKKSLQASRLVGALEKLRIEKVRKLSLMACNVTNTKTAASRNFLVTICKEFESRWNSSDRPMIAGYDDYVYGSKSGKKYLDSGSNEPMTGSGHKQVWVCKSGLLTGGYKQISLEKSGWSDKEHFETNLKTTTVL
ncbi:hypothetical protein [Pelagibius sp. Alg239-R121]|uniref:hypothetical protein n=1 Tax=Pelagibius sp. Alg239-R121 TaxID=2993448 RepID=UPI0024A799AA|nr:hypothetical protein [Pelagibius sp. Alg239-R121]